jgi:DNA polymerase I-like protein with 3'-5' exonuclease and polymerase domains
MLIFDVESDNFLEDATRLHCISILDTETGELTTYNDQQDTLSRPLWEGLVLLGQAEEVCGHNILKYDLPLIRKLYSEKWSPRPDQKQLDTLILARLLFPETGDSDDKMIRRGKLPPKYRGLHKLEAWGYRLGILKGEYTGTFEAWSQEMEDYCVQDVRVTAALLSHCRLQRIPEVAVDIEHGVARIVSRQEIKGFYFDQKKALDLVVLLSKKRLQLEEELKATFGWWWAKDGQDLVPKKDNKARGYTVGAPLSKIKAVHFNPGSRHHIARVLKKRFGWKPTSFTPTGEPEVSEESLSGIRHPEARLLETFLMVQKRLGYLAEGKQALLNFYRSDGRIHGSVNTNAAVTGRMTHSNPNIAQNPRIGTAYGKEFRELFRAAPGFVLCGIDASGIEARMLAHYMARYDAGRYIAVVTEGTKEDGTDIHTVNMRALEITDRDDAKTWFYAFLYGAGDEKLGLILTKVRNKSKCVRVGKAARYKFLANLEAMGRLISTIKHKAKLTHKLNGLDGRKLHCRSDHSAPNTLLQGAAAIVMKKALVLFDDALQQKGFRPNDDYEFVANIHDEWQAECRPEIAEQVGQLGVDAIRLAGEFFALRCPLGGEYRVGATWSDTH